MAWHLNGAKPLSEPMLEYCEFDPCEILVKFHTSWFKKMHFTISSTKWQPLCLGLNELRLPGYRMKSHDTIYWNNPNNVIRGVMSLFLPIRSSKIRLQSSAVITRSNISTYCIYHCRNWGRISIRGWTNKRHPIPRPNGRAMGCLSWIFLKKLTAL